MSRTSRNGLVVSSTSQRCRKPRFAVASGTWRRTCRPAAPCPSSIDVQLDGGWRAWECAPCRDPHDASPCGPVMHRASSNNPSFLPSFLLRSPRSRAVLSHPSDATNSTAYIDIVYHKYGQSGAFGRVRPWHRFASGLVRAAKGVTDGGRAHQPHGDRHSALPLSEIDLTL